MDDVKRSVGENIRKAREAKGLLQRELAKNAGVPVRTIGRIERGEVDARLSTLARIADAMGLELEKLLK